VKKLQNYRDWYKQAVCHLPTQAVAVFGSSSSWSTNCERAWIAAQARPERTESQSDYMQREQKVHKVWYE
jgi:hypothetical protein